MNAFKTNVKESFHRAYYDITNLKKTVVDLQLEIQNLKEQIYAQQQEPRKEIVHEKEIVKEVPVVTKVIKEVKEPTKVSSDITPAEREILSVISKSPNGQSYKELAVLLNKSPNTIKNHINSIKKRGIPLSEVADEEGRKTFYFTQVSH